MKDIYEIISDNFKEAINLLKKSKNDELNIIEQDCYVLITNRDNEYCDVQATKVRLNEEKNDIEIYIEEWNEWISVNLCCVSTENFVYLAIDDAIN